MVSMIMNRKMSMKNNEMRIEVHAMSLMLGGNECREGFAEKVPTC